MLNQYIFLKRFIYRIKYLRCLLKYKKVLRLRHFVAMIISDSIKFEGPKDVSFFCIQRGARVPSPVCAYQNSYFDLPGFQVANSQGKNSKK